MPATPGEGGAAGAPTNDAQTDAERLPELARRAERAFNENVDRLRGQARDAQDTATQQLEQARTYVIERVNDKPLQTTLTMLGAGFVLGVLFAGRRR